MSGDALDALHDIRAFIAREIVDTVPAHLRSELRAALKLLDEVAAELDTAYPMFRAECRDSLELIEAADHLLAIDARETAALSTALNEASLSLRDLSALHDQIGALLLARYRTLRKPPDGATSSSHELCQRLHDNFAAQARRRARWQSVFPAEIAQD